MEQAVIDINSIRPILQQYVDWTSTIAIQQAALQAIIDAGKPPIPQYVVDQVSEWQSVIEARNYYDNQVVYFNDLITGQTGDRAQTGNDIIALLPPNVWVWLSLTDPDDGDISKHYWIGYNTNDADGYIPYLQVINDEASQEPLPPLTNNM